MRDPVAGEHADQRQRNGPHHNDRQQERLVIRHQQQVDEHQRHHEGRAQIAEHVEREAHFAAPQQLIAFEVARWSFGEAEVAGGEGGAVGQLLAVEHGVQAQGGIDRAGMNHFAAHINHGMLVTAVDGFGQRGLLHRGDARERNDLALRILDRHVEQLLRALAIGARHAHDDVDRLQRVAVMHRTDLQPGYIVVQQLDDLPRHDTRHRRFLAVDLDAVFRRRGRHRVVLVHQAIGFVEIAQHVFRGGAQSRIARAIQLGHDLRTHRRARRGFEQFDESRWETRTHRGELLVELLHNGMRLHRALVLAHQIDANLRKVVAALEHVAAHQRGEVDRRRLPNEGLVVDHIRIGRQHIAHRTRHLIGALERRARRGVDLHQEGIGVVVGQHLEFDAQSRQRAVHARGADELPGRHQHGHDEQQQHGEEHQVALNTVAQQRLDQAQIGRVQLVLLVRAFFF